jgi:UDPglucose 6-dehydrogenase
MKIIIFGAGYVGMSLSALIAQKHEVIIVDIDPKKVDLINNKKSPINDKDIVQFFLSKKLNISATTNYNQLHSGADYVIIATPTNYDPINNKFDTSLVESVVDEVMVIDRDVPIIIKSTVPLGYTEKIKVLKNKNNIIFSPEFLTENRALYDNLYPSRIIVGSYDDEGDVFGKILLDCAKKKDVPFLKMNSNEAEAVKLFSNTYLALRIAYFNELDSYCEVNNIDTKNIIDGIGHDPRIGDYYNNPSFGYGGYCLPKDTQQLLANFSNVPNNIISAVVKSNYTRKSFIVKSVLKKNVKCVGIYRLSMKSGSDNFRESAIIDIIIQLTKKNISVIIYEPELNQKKFHNAEIITSFDEFIKKSNLILANRMSSELLSLGEKVYSRDIYNIN